MQRFHFISIIFTLISLTVTYAANTELQPVLGTKCLPNQVVTKLTVYEDGAVEAECNKLPCGISGAHCNDNQTSCRAETDTFSGMKWAFNGQSILQRCCTLSVPRKIYVGTDLVSLGSYYTGGPVDQKDLYSKEGPEFDFVSNIRTEQGGVRVWVYRIICPKQIGSIGGSPISSRAQGISAAQSNDGGAGRSQEFEKRHQYLKKQSESNGNIYRGGVVAQSASGAAYRPINPLQYRPAILQNQRRDSPMQTPFRGASERLI